MNSEESRLRTFSTWPSDAAVDPARIAKAGFFHTGQGLEVQCFSCGGKITEWNYGDQVMAKHKRLDPQCPFVINPSSSGNVPKLNTASTSSPQPLPLNNNSGDSNDIQSVSVVNIPPTPQSLRNEACRLETYANWPAAHIVSPENLAKAGFYSLQLEDKVKCAYCNGIAGFWEPGDDPKVEHKRHFPYCNFVLSGFNPENISPLPSPNTPLPINNTKLVSSDNLQELGIEAHKGPRQPRCATVESRLRTFSSWPEELIQTPEMLAEAGFYYVGTGDQVRCFYCDGGLRHWDPEDEPWVEHARWFPTCSFIRLIKGQDFIYSCNPQQLPHNNLTPMLHLPQHPNGRIPNPRALEISDQDMQVYMNSEPALAALGIGLPMGRVKQAIRQRIQETGCNYSSADALIEATLNLQLEDADVPDADIQIQQEVASILSRVVEKSLPPQRLEAEKSIPTHTEVLPKLSLEEENRQLKEARLCKICMDNEIGVVFLPCGHLTTCVNCAPSLKDCPVCRSVIKGTVRTFLS